MSSDLFEALCLDLDFAVFEAKGKDHFECLSEPPSWLEQYWPGVGRGCRVDHHEFSPFLENFLIDANEHWLGNHQGQLKSGPWVEAKGPHQDRSLEASALNVQGQRILILKSLGDEFEKQRRQMQVAREHLLTQEQLEREVHRRTAQIRAREEEIAIRLIGAAGYRDEETGAHIRRIGSYSAAMATEIGWSQSQIDDLKLAAPMHDMGKIAISDKILLKPGKLSAEEFEIMKNHAKIGQDMLAGSGIPMLDLAAEIAGGHHEKWDGSGYPLGLSGEDIPDSARIVAIADVYDALVHKRIYKEAFSEEKSIKLMDEMVGTGFDPNLYCLFKSILDQIRKIRDQIPDEHTVLAG